MIKNSTGQLFQDFVDDVLSVPWDVRKDMFSIAEKHYEGQMFRSEEIYAYIFWRVYEMPVDDFLSWGGLFQEYGLYKPEKYNIN